MAIRFDASADGYTRTFSLTVPHTFMAWVRIITDRNDYSSVFSFENGSEFFFGFGPTGTRIDVYAGGDNDGSDLAVGVWYHLAIVSSSTTRWAYVNGKLDVTVTTGGASIENLWIGRTTALDFLNGRMAAAKLWHAVLTQSEIVAEMRQYSPIRLANLDGFYPFLDVGTGTRDYSGFGTALTSNGTLTAEDGPPIPWEMGPAGGILQSVRF